MNKSTFLDIYTPFVFDEFKVYIDKSSYILSQTSEKTYFNICFSGKVVENDELVYPANGLFSGYYSNCLCEGEAAGEILCSAYHLIPNKCSWHFLKYFVDDKNVREILHYLTKNRNALTLSVKK